MASADLHEYMTGTGFSTSPVPYLISDADLRIQGVNPAFEKAVGFRRSILVGEHLFDAFPDNPADPECDGVEKLAASLDTVFRTGRPHWVGVQRFDMPDPQHPGQFVHKAWVPVNSPIVQDGRTIAVLQRADDVTAVLAGNATVPLHIRAVAQRLGQEFPALGIETVIGVLTHSHQVVMDVLGRPHGPRAESLARMRLELVAGHPGDQSPSIRGI